MKKFFIPLLSVCLFWNASAQVKVGDNPTTINTNAVLELESADKGLLLPRVALTSTTDAAPLSAHVAGMKVYNTATAGTAPNDVTPGMYYNDGSKWVKLGDAANAKWVDGSTAGDIELVNPTGTDVIKYTNAGKKVYDTNDESMDYVHYVTGVVTTENSVNANGYNLNRTLSSNIVQDDVANTNLAANKNNLLIADSDNRALSWKTGFNTISTTVTNSNNYPSLVAQENRAYHNGTGIVTSLSGMSNLVQSSPTSRVTSLYGLQSTVSTNSNNLSTNAIGVYGEVSLRGAGTVTNAVGVDSRFSGIGALKYSGFFRPL